MMSFRRAHERGSFDYGWLKIFSTFSFGEYQDPRFTGVGALKAINECTLKGGSSFSNHTHRDVELLTYVVDGSIEIKESSGRGHVIRSGEIHYLGAGSGVSHAEANFSKKEDATILQMWITPEKSGLAPANNFVSLLDARGGNPANDQWKLVASYDGHESSMVIRQHLSVYISRLHQGEAIEYVAGADRRLYMHVVRGQVNVNGNNLAEGDGVSITKDRQFSIMALQNRTEFFFLDMR
ncbi:MAG: pirin family protein [Oligoflexia bacterium]|nr:pirin family protein [Oligoflexia bacterium]MBF0364280.1 pirin family protein [Oligoflexia bacterium]